MRFKESRSLAFTAFGVLAAALMSLTGRAAGADGPDPKAIESAYEPQVRPLLERYCHRCHSGDEPEADIDLAAFATMADVRRQPRIWVKVREMLDTRQMPPKKARKQPTDAERARLREWVRDYLTTEARARAGDPGRVVLRRLSNAEYTYTVRDLTGVDSLDPVREFPVDGAAGEGFTNTGDALVMSPALVTKYLEAAKGIARHAILLPDGIRFSSYTTRRDWTDELLARIRQFYGEFTDAGGSSAVNLQGIKFDTNKGGRLPLKEFLEATLGDRDALTSGQKTLEAVARERGLNARYLAALWRALTAEAKEEPSLLLDRLRARWRNAKVKDAPALTAWIERWQKALWKFNSIGHIGRAGGPPSWLQAVSPIASRQEFKLKLPTLPAGQDAAIVYLIANDAGDGKAADYVTWKNPQLQGGGKAALPLRYAAGLLDHLTKLRREMLANTARYLGAVAEVTPETDVSALASTHGLHPELLKGWLRYLGVGDTGPVEVTGHFKEKLLKGGNYDFINGWGTGATPSISANSSDQEVRIPGIARPHSVVAHPSPTLFAAIGWHSPIDAVVRVEARLADAHPECGNGVEWVVEHRTGDETGEHLWHGDFGARGSATMQPLTIAVRKGELVSFIIGPRQGKHSCDLTAVDFVITETEGVKRVWDLAKDVSGNILQSNPHADRHGNETTWHFYKGAMAGLDKKQGRLAKVPPASLLALWQTEKDPARRRELAGRVQAMAIGEPPSGHPTEEDSPDAVLFGQLQFLAMALDHAVLLKDVKPDGRFGKHPLGHAVDATDLVVQAPVVVEFRVPAELAAGRELVVTGELESKHGHEGSVQLAVSTTSPDRRDLSAETPIIVTAADGSDARRRVESAFEDFRQLFPAALCYTQIVPVDEVVTLTLYYREDEHLQRLMLDDAQTKQLDRLWDEVRFVSHEPLEYLVAFEQLVEFSTQDRPDLVKAWKPHRKRTMERASAFRQRLIDTEPAQVEAVLKLADRAWRRKLTDAEGEDLRGLYEKLREDDIPHDEAIRLTLARALTSPAFLYRLEEPPPGDKSAPVSNLELASRLSYFLWSSMPDADLLRVAEAGELTDEKTLLVQTRRMLKDDRTRRLAIEFGCQWLHIRDFDQNDEKNEKLYPEFASLRGAMYEESVRFFEDLFRNDGSVLGLLNADHTFLNESLAKHYGIGGVSGPAWQRVEGVRGKGRGGILGMATVLAKQSGASRTSPILRGNWVSETLLGERLPRPPANVPQLPDAVPSGLTARQLIERHSSLPECAKCHARIDPYGFALEQYDAIGRLRPEAVDTKTTLVDGKSIEGIEGLRDYLLDDRRDDFLRQFCRKLLGYSLGRAVQLSDEPLLAKIRRQLAANGYRVRIAVEAIVASPQFRGIRGREHPLSPKR